MAAFDTCGNLEAAVAAFSAGISMSDMRDYHEEFSIPLWAAFINDEVTRRVLHVPDTVPLLKADCSKIVESALNVDSMKDIRGLLSFLLTYLPITVYTGNFDLMDGTWSNEVFLDSLWHWEDRESWFLSRRFVWRPLPCVTQSADDSSSSDYNHLPMCSESKADPHEVYGYSKSYGHLSFVVVTQAGHMVPTTQPERALDLFYRFLHHLPYYNKHQEKLNNEDAQKICAVLQCDREGHGRCDTSGTDCQCDEGWTGPGCTINVKRISNQLFQQSWLRATTLSTYIHRAVLSPQSIQMYYFQVEESTLQALNKAKRRKPSDPHFIDVRPGTPGDRLSSAAAASCSFEPPLQLKVVVREARRSTAAPFPLSTSVHWISAIHNEEDSSAIRFFGDFDPANLFLGRNLHGDRQSVGPQLLSIDSSSSSDHITVIGLTQCDHYAVKIANSEGSIYDIPYEIEVTVREILTEAQDTTAVSWDLADSSSLTAQFWMSSSWFSLSPWILLLLTAFAYCWLYISYRHLVASHTSIHEATPLLRS